MAESLWKRFAELPVEIEGYRLERLEKPVTRGFTRVTTIVHLSGGGEEGLGEDVTWYAEHHDREQAAGAILPLAGSWDPEAVSAALPIPDPPRPRAYQPAGPAPRPRCGGGLPPGAPRAPRAEGRDRARARAAPGTRDVGRPDSLRRGRRAAPVPAADAELEAVPFRLPARAARLLRPLRG